LIDFIGQPSLLTSTAFVKGLLEREEEFPDDYDDRNGDGSYTYEQYGFWIALIRHGWKEAVSKILKGGCQVNCERMWKMMRWQFPEKFFGESPYSDEMDEAILAEFKTKRQLEEEWVEKNMSKFFVKYEEFLVKLPKNLHTTIIRYATTWLDV
jgi:hypothetical protein